MGLISQRMEAQPEAGRRRQPLDQRGSAALSARARAVLPGGVTNSNHYGHPHPVFVARAAGAHVWDVDGNRYIDYQNGSTALFLGHSPAPVARALEDAIGRGLRLATEGPDTVALAELVCELVPCADRVRFEATGTLATAFAVRLARAATGRRIVMKAQGGYHGRNTDLDVEVSFPFDEPEGAGHLPEQQQWTHLFPFNDVEGTRRALDAAGDDVAALIVEPVIGQSGFLPATPAYLHVLREETRKRGILLIFDEIITGFRLALGGAQERFGVVPDLCTLGKILGGGMPIGAVAGRADVMNWYSPERPGGKRGRAILSSGTYAGLPLSMAAGIAALRWLRDHCDEVYPVLEARTARLRAGLEDALAGFAARSGLSVSCHGIASGFCVTFPLPGAERPSCPADIPLRTAARFNFRLADEMARRGVLTNLGGGTLSIAHDDDDVAATLECARAAGAALEES